MNPDLSRLQPYPFEKLNALKAGITPPAALDHIALSIGEPKHDFPRWIVDIISENADGFGKYPVNEGTPGLLRAICDWVQRRYGVTLDPTQQIMALNGTREGLYNAMMALCPETKGDKRPVVLIPNPFYYFFLQNPQ